MRKKLYIHLGYPKTASTLMQNHILNKIPNINYMGFPFENSVIRNIINDIIFLDDSAFKKKLSIIEKEVFPLILDKKINLISHNLLMNCTYLKSNNLSQGINRLKLLFDNKKYDLKLFYLLRSQSEFIPTFYCQFYRRLIKINSEWASYNKFINSMKNDDHKIFENFKYYNVYKYLKKLFEPKNLGLFFYEDLKNNPNLFFKKLSIFLNKDITYLSKQSSFKEHKTSKINKFEYERKYVLMHKLFKYYIKNKFICDYVYTLCTKDKVLISPRYNSIIKNHFKNSNKKLEESIKINLKNKNYH